MSEILKVTMYVTDIEDLTKTVRSDKEAKIKDHQQVRKVTATNGKADNKIKIVLLAKPALLEGFMLDEITLKISADQTQLYTDTEEENEEDGGGQGEIL